MRSLWPILLLIWRDQRQALLRGAALSVVVLAMGVALLGLSGWFITAAAAAGLAGAGATFDVFRPSAMVRFLALGRAAARYGERVLTHDATLRALEGLRLRVLAGQLAAPYARMIRIRGAQALNRLTADIDALDGLPLLLALPVLAGGVVLILSGIALWALIGPAIALWVALGYFIGAIVVFRSASGRMIPLSRRAEQAAQAFRSRLIDLIRARTDLVLYGALLAQAQAVRRAEMRRLTLRQSLDRAERWTGTGLSLLSTLIASGSLALGIAAAQTGHLEPAFAALGFFVSLALAETLAPLRRAVGDLGRMADAARRVGRDLGPAPGDATESHSPLSNPGTLSLTDVTLLRPGTDRPVLQGLSLSVRPSETLALVGPSGAGKSSVLLAIAGLHPLARGTIFLGDTDLSTLPDADLRAVVTLLPQRSQLMAGTVADALRLGNTASDDDLWQALKLVQLDTVVRSRGGLAMAVGPRGAGLSGGEARRLTLARALLRRPAVLLLDEPTEGLDDPTARAVLHGLRAYLPDAAIVMAAHRSAETDFADRRVAIK